MRRRGDAWQLIVYAGQGRQVSRTFRGSERQAEKALAALVTEVEKKRTVPTRGRTVLTLLDAWHAARSSSWTDKTVAEHRRFIDKTIGPELGTVLLSRLTTSDVDAFYGSLSRRGLKPGAVRRIHSVVRSALEQGVRWGWLGVNPAATANPPKVPKSPVRPPVPDELARLLEVVATDNPDLHLFVHLAATSGARRGELLRLRWSDVNTAAGELVIRKGKTAAATRRMALDQVTLDLLARHQTSQQARAGACGVRTSQRSYIFSYEADAASPWTGDAVTHAFVRLRRRAGVEGVRLHDLRHYVATQLITAGVDVRTVAGRLGHASPYTTLGVYSHFQPASDRAAAELLARLLKESQDNPDKSG